MFQLVLTAFAIRKYDRRLVLPNENTCLQLMKTALIHEYITWVFFCYKGSKRLDNDDYIGT